MVRVVGVFSSSFTPDSSMSFCQLLALPCPCPGTPTPLVRPLFAPCTDASLTKCFTTLRPQCSACGCENNPWSMAEHPPRWCVSTNFTVLCSVDLLLLLTLHDTRPLLHNSHTSPKISTFPMESFCPSERTGPSAAPHKSRSAHRSINSGAVRILQLLQGRHVRAL